MVTAEKSHIHIPISILILECLGEDNQESIKCTFHVQKSGVI